MLVALKMLACKNNINLPSFSCAWFSWCFG